MRLTLPVTPESEMIEFEYFLKEKTKFQFFDGNLWFSILTKPPQSAFKRIERVTCCFVLLFITMLMNILYYDAKNDESTQTANRININIGPFRITLTEVFNFLNKFQSKIFFNIFYLR